MVVCLIILLVLTVLYLLLTMCRTGNPELNKLKGWAYAHRGLHGNGVPENSMYAFRLAKEAGYGIELDIHLLADGNLCVIHDSLLKRTTGLEGKIEDLTTEQLKQCYLEGTNETIPTFQEVLDLYAGAAPLIVELKPDMETNNQAALTQAACRMLESYDGAYCIESFDPRCIAWLRKNKPHLVRGQLAENFLLKTKKETNMPWLVSFFISNQLLNFWTFPDFIAYKFRDRKSLSNFVCTRIWGGQGVTWTLKSQEEYDEAVQEGWIPIFEGFRP